MKHTPQHKPGGLVHNRAERARVPSTAAEFVDNRSSAEAIRKSVDEIDRSPQATAMRALSDSMSNGQKALGRVKPTIQMKANPIIQRMAQDAKENEFKAGDVVDCTAILVLRAGRIFIPSAKALGEDKRNADFALPGKKGAITWKAGTNTGNSLMASTAALEGRGDQQVVLKIPDSLEIRQTGPANHAEIVTKVNMSASEIGKALAEVKLTGLATPSVAQLRARE